MNGSNCQGGPHERLWIESHKERILGLPCNRGIVMVVSLTWLCRPPDFSSWVCLNAKNSGKRSHWINHLNPFAVSSMVLALFMSFSLSSLIVGQSTNPSSLCFSLAIFSVQDSFCRFCIATYPFLFHRRCHPLSLLPVFSGCLGIQTQSLVSCYSSMFCKINDWNKTHPHKWRRC